MRSAKRLHRERRGAADGEAGLGQQARIGGAVHRPIGEEDDVARFFGYQLSNLCVSESGKKPVSAQYLRAFSHWRSTRAIS
jgi:hypothetical protein